MMAYLKELKFVQNMKSDPYLQWIPWLTGFLYLKFFIGYCLVDFQLLKWKLYFPVSKTFELFTHLRFTHCDKIVV